MSIMHLVQRSLSYYWRTNLAVVLGVAVAVAVLAGALLVGDSVRASLRDLVVQRLGQTSFVVTSSSFFREQLSTDVQSDPQFGPNGFVSACPLISLQAQITHEPSKRAASAIQVYGVDDRFWRFNARNRTGPQDRSVYMSQTLASELGANNGDAVLLRLEKPSDIPLESLHSKKDDLGKTLRLNLSEILDSSALGEFSLQPQQSGVRAIFVSIKLLQTELEQTNKVNLILVSENQTTHANAFALDKLLRQRISLEDLGIKLRSLTVDDRPVVSLEHESKMISDSLDTAARQTANSLSLRSIGIFSYLANSISSGDKSIPYSLVTAIDQDAFSQLVPNPRTNADSPSIILNEWAASDLAVRVGDRVTLEYYLWHNAGGLETKTATFELAGVVPISGFAADRDLVPEYPGITGSENLSDWDPPFPIDLKRIRQKDEDYWHQYRTTPKAFISLQIGQNLWQSRFGKLTSIRLNESSGANSLNTFPQRLRDSLHPTFMGVVVLPVRSEGLQASRGATDFGEYFLYFSFFLVVSALLLMTLFFKLGVEQRIREIGTLRAIGFGPAKTRSLLLSEGLILAISGSVLGLLGAIAYGQFMMFGLRTWWVEAVGTNALRLHVSTQSLVIGVAGGIVAAVVCIAITLRALGRRSTRSMLTGSISDIPSRTERRRFLTPLRLAFLFTALGLLLLIGAAFHIVGQAAGFFGAGTLFLAALLCYQSSWLGRRGHGLLSGQALWPIARVGFRNATYRPGRSVLCIALIASAVFIIVAVDSFRHREGAATHEKKSGTGGYPLLAESVVPLVNDPNSREGQETLNLADIDSDPALKGATFTRFRVQPGDDASCLNLYQPRNPKIVAAADDFVASGRFNFQNSLATNKEESANPWLLLNRQFDDGAVPVIADANSLTYVLHLKVGEDFLLPRGADSIRLRVVAALSDSLFQSELLMSEKNFVRLFPDRQGYTFFLIDLPEVDRAQNAAAALEDRLSDFGFDVQPTAERLASFHRVENTYLSTFQMLGGLGLILGTIGLAAVLLRNVLERRRELALMRAVGYDSRDFTVMILSENTLLLVAGVATGTICALLAILPIVLARPGQFAQISLGLLLLAVLISGLLASIAATWVAIRTPLLQALRAE
ncbi:MAG TPA: ABC transporter permease [Pyrinomonadaceae bacterium]|nr:ABC transporter permease [Pyrinomonadaceae bacterium]